MRVQPRQRIVITTVRREPDPEPSPLARRIAAQLWRIADTGMIVAAATSGGLAYIPIANSIASAAKYGAVVVALSGSLGTFTTYVCPDFTTRMILFLPHLCSRRAPIPQAVDDSGADIYWFPSWPEMPSSSEKVVKIALIWLIAIGVYCAVTASITRP